jgi:hypothetical protein
LQRTVETSATDRNQLAHALDTQAALQKYYFSDLLVDAVSPVSSRFWRRASTFCKAPLKKSTSRVLEQIHELAMGAGDGCQLTTEEVDIFLLWSNREFSSSGSV